MSQSQNIVSPIGSYVERALTFTIKLGKGSFGESGFDTVKLEGLRAHASILKNGPPSNSNATMEIYGMTPGQMNHISTLGSPVPMDRLNIITIEAGDATNGMAEVFTGKIQDAWQNLDSQPDTFMQINAFVTLVDNTKPTSPTSFQGSADVATMMAGIASKMQRNFENNGVTTKLANPYFAGTAGEQAQALARAANIEMFDDGTKLTIWPKSGSRGGTIPLISPESGLIGYPKWSSYGMRFRTLFNPNITFGGKIKMKSGIEPANGDWIVSDGLSYDLSSQITNGPWFTDVNCYRNPAAPPPGTGH